MRSLIALTLFTATAAAAPFEKSGISDWTAVPQPATEPTFVPPTATRTKLANGMALLVVENHKLPIISMSLLVPAGGTAYDPQQKPGIAAFTADMLDEGAGGMSAIQIASELDRLGAGIKVGASIDAAYVSVSTLTKTLDATLELAAKIVTAPTFDAKDFERLQGDRGTALELRRDRPREVASILLGSGLYGLDSPYGHPGSGMRESFKSITLDELKSFYVTHWTPATMTLVVVGDVDAKTLAQKLDKNLGAWKPAVQKPIAVPAAVAVKTHPSRLLLVDRKDAAQSDIRIGIVGLDRKDPRFYAFEVLTTTMGGGFTSRLMQRLREQLGITYTIRAGEDWRLAPGPFTIATAIQTPATAQGVRETIKIVDDLAAIDVPPAELDKSKQNLIRALPAQFETNAGVAASFSELALFGLPDDWYAHYAESIRKITAADVKAVAKAVIPSSRFVIAIVGDMAKIRTDVDKLQLGPAEIHDLYGLPVPVATKPKK